jgi:hypothetical protein
MRCDSGDDDLSNTCVAPPPNPTPSPSISIAPTHPSPVPTSLPTTGSCTRGGECMNKGDKCCSGKCHYVDSDSCKHGYRCNYSGSNKGTGLERERERERGGL